MIKVDEEFTTRAQKNIAIELLTVWKTKPTWMELSEIGNRHGRKEKAVSTVIDRLIEAELFTEDRGSMYLYRIQLENEAKSKTTIPSIPSIPFLSSTSTQVILPTRTNEGENEEEKDDLSPIKESEENPLTEIEGEITAEVETMKRKFTVIEGSMKEMEKNIQNLVTVVQGLAVKMPEKTFVEKNEEEVEKPEKADSPESVEALVKRTILETLNEMQVEKPNNPEVALADVEKIADVSDPTIDLETENPLDDAVESVIELEGSIISRKTVGFTPKSLMLYDLTRKKGFRGNFADFVNSCISSALKGRKFKLTVEEDVD